MNSHRSSSFEQGGTVVTDFTLPSDTLVATQELAENHKPLRSRPLRRFLGVCAVSLFTGFGIGLLWSYKNHAEDQSSAQAAPSAPSTTPLPLDTWTDIMQGENEFTQSTEGSLGDGETVTVEVGRCLRIALNNGTVNVIRNPITTPQERGTAGVRFVGGVAPTRDRDETGRLKHYAYGFRERNGNLPESVQWGVIPGMEQRVVETVLQRGNPPEVRNMAGFFGSNFEVPLGGVVQLADTIDIPGVSVPPGHIDNLPAAEPRRLARLCRLP